MPTTTNQRDLVKEYLTYIQVEKGLARHTLESYRRDLAATRSLGKPSLEGQSPTLLDLICANGSRNFLAKDSRLHPSREPSARRAVSFVS